MILKEGLSDALKKVSEDPELKVTIEKTGGKPDFWSRGNQGNQSEKPQEFSTPALKELGLYVGQ